MDTPIPQEEFVQLIEAHKRLILKICHLYGKTQEDKEDMYQEIIVQLWSSLPAFRGESKFTTWMYRVALNTAIAGLRKKRRRGVLIPLEDSHTGRVEQADPDEHRPRDTVAELHAAIQALTPVEKAIVTLYLENKSYQEMEEVLGINEGTLRVKMTRIKDKLKKITAISNPYGT